jgi:HEAT repeat protein
MANVNELIEQLDGSSNKFKEAERNLISLGDAAIDSLLRSVDNINKNLLQGKDPERNMRKLEIRITILGKIGKTRAVKAILDALADSAGTISVLQRDINNSYDNPNPSFRHNMLLMTSERKNAAKSLNEAAIQALASIGDPALLYIEKYISSSSPEVQKSLKRARSKITKKPWQFWR